MDKDTSVKNGFMPCSELQKSLDDTVDSSEPCKDNDADVGTSENAMTSSSPYHVHNASVLEECDLCVLDDNRIFYIHHTTRSSFWEPPWAAFRCRFNLPYGFEQARDEHGRTYFIDHVNKRTTYNDPRQVRAPEGKRTVTIRKKSGMGFGFVAAGQMPTIIQFVSTEGPSNGLLFSNDQILAVNGGDVSEKKKDEVVLAVRASGDLLEITVEQLPTRPKSSRRNYKVRFTDRVSVASRPDSPTDYPPPLPNVMRVFLENGQTRSFPYDETTTVQDILSSLLDKLQFNLHYHFSLAIEYSLGARSSRISLLRPTTTIKSIIMLPNSEHLRCVLRFSFVPRDTFSLLTDDPRAVEYFYAQCIGDVIRGRFAFEMRYEACIRLAALHMQQVAIESNLLKDGRVSISKLEKEYGMETFLPEILLENVKRREIRKHLRFYLKRDSERLSELIRHQGNSEKNNGNDSARSLVSATAEVVSMLRLKYIHIVCHLPSFGGRSFSVTFKESQLDMIMQIDSQSGIVVRHPGKTQQPAISIAFQLISKLLAPLEFILDKDEIDDAIVHIAGYYRINIGIDLAYEVDESMPPLLEERPKSPPPYSAVHWVAPSGWNYAPEASPGDKPIDLSENPPAYEIANAFVEEASTSSDKQSELPIIDAKRKEILQESCKNSIMTASTDSKKLLKATDSLLIKNSRELHLKEMVSPLLKRSSNPEGLKTAVISDSSDTEDSSWSSPIRSPLLNKAIDELDHIDSFTG
ncbi:hypothetical protein WR25_11257 isoform A [Diploscapter pachys]|uniref:FERM domain-containing protein n=2 Tax=Diploscapter pachys TaxID=2018661 RepID=A0A2A2L8A1_9BILA|nr:hypothetical protein WR25_11257 isoform A [Diploscapter pachys]